MDTPLRNMTVVLGVTGSIAAYKAPLITRLLIKEGCRVRVVMTQAAVRFISPQTFAPLIGQPVHTEMFEESPSGRPAHLMIPADADFVLVAPASADFIARLAAGLADDLLAAVCVAATCPLLVAPAMHHQMWANAIVQANVARLASLGVGFIGPERGELASGDEGAGRMSEPQDIVAALRAMAVKAVTA